MSTSTKQNLLLQHPSHEHPLKLLDLRNEKTRTHRWCLLCHRKILAEAYTCQERCMTSGYYHRVCVEAPPQIDRHPLHPDHPLPLIRAMRCFICDACCEAFEDGGSLFRCDKCDFDLDICCAMSMLSDEGGSKGGNTSAQITLPLHPHTLTSFSTKHDFVWGRDCYICRETVEGDGYMCLRRRCEFVIHKRCIQDPYYADGTKAPRVYHDHPLETFVGEDTGSRTCAGCGSDKSGEFIGCASCDVFYHRHCFQVPEILQYPPHNQNHTLVLFSDIDTELQCESCSTSLKNEIYYRCTSCDFFLHIGCASKVLTYCEEGMSAKIVLSWHKHQLILCHQTGADYYDCCYRNGDSMGPAYVCKQKHCEFLLHGGCTEMKSTITHPHHPDHPLTLCGDNDRFCSCKACRSSIYGLRFSCEYCLVDLHVQCAVRFPSHKHYLHEHNLLRLEEYKDLECNRCGRSTGSPVFRCFLCDFNLHEECMELPQVVESKIHWHPLTLHETFLEDDSGEYYCEHCENTRDPRLGAYVCGECKLSMPRIYHIECVLPEIGKVYEKKRLLPPGLEKLKKQIADQREEVHRAREKLDKATRVLDELVEQLDTLIDEESEDEIWSGLV